MKRINQILGSVSGVNLFGWLPLDMILHFTFGMVITILISIYRKSAIQALIVCLIIAIAKELYDSTTLVASWNESIKDIFVTMIYPILIFIISIIRKKGGAHNC